LGWGQVLLGIGPRCVEEGRCFLVSWFLCGLLFRFLGHVSGAIPGSSSVMRGAQWNG